MRGLKILGIIFTSVLCVFFMYSLRAGNLVKNVADDSDILPLKVVNLQPSTDTVIIKQMKYIPKVITIHKGESIVFINKGIVKHNIVDFPKKEWSSPTLEPGDSWTFTPKKGGVYYCSLHVVMKGAIVIK